MPLMLHVPADSVLLPSDRMLLAYLERLGAGGPVSISDASTRTGLAPATVRRSLERLHSLGVLALRRGSTQWDQSSYELLQRIYCGK